MPAFLIYADTKNKVVVVVGPFAQRPHADYFDAGLNHIGVKWMELKEKLKGNKVSAWAAARQVRESYPRFEVQDEMVIPDQWLRQIIPD